MTANAIVSIEVDLAEGIAPADVARRLALPIVKTQGECVALSNFFASLPNRNATVFVRVDSATGVAASITTAITGANIAAAEYISFVLPSGIWTVTAVSSGAASGDGTFNTSGTNATCATNIANAINSLNGLSRWVVASTNSGDLIVTARDKGTVGNLYRLVDGTVNGLGSSGLFTGGIDTYARTTASIAITNANVSAGDTVTIGTIAFEAVASGATGNQFNIGASATLTGDALAAAINASGDLTGLVTAANVSGTVTITYSIDARAAEALCRLATSDATAFALTQPATTLTVASAQATRAYTLGA